MNFKALLKSLVLIVVILSAVSFDYIANNNTSCNQAYFLPGCNGQQRWDVKTMQDPNAHLVNFTPTTNYSSIKKIKKIDREVWHEIDPRSNVEYLTVQFKCKIKKYKEETGDSGDNDYHVVIYQEGNSQITMVAEIPDPNCPNVKNSKYVKNFKDSRKVIDDNDNTSGSSDWKTVTNKTYTIYGVLFRDKKHNAVGQLPNYVEIHPVLSLTPEN